MWSVDSTSYKLEYYDILFINYNFFTYWIKLHKNLINFNNFYNLLNFIFIKKIILNFF